MCAASVFLSCSSRPEPTGKSQQQSGKDIILIEQEMVLIPGGEFTMGSEDESEEYYPHKVYIDSFYLDKYEVTNAQYLKYIEDTGAPYPIFWGIDKFRCGDNFPNHPIIGISWAQAQKYAEWCGKRLPTEAEWEYAARGGLDGVNFPNGDDTSLEEMNFKGSDGTDPVGTYPPNGYGLHETCGNVGEWVADWWSDDYLKNSPYKNPQGPEDGTFKVVRGGGWFAGKYCNRVYARTAIPANWVDFNAGFRCAKNLH
jgi:sulfatase modifying factor 1